MSDISEDALKARLDIEAIAAQVADTAFTLDASARRTSCVLTLTSGYVVTGESIMHDAVFDVAAGEAVARLDAINHAWTLSGEDLFSAFPQG